MAGALFSRHIERRGRYLSSYQTGGQESIRQEARRRGVTVYRVRAERASRGEQAPVKRIPWNKLPDEQVQDIHEYVPRRKWRALVNLVVRNIDTWKETGRPIDEYDYWEEYIEIMGVELPDYDTVAANIKEEGFRMFWYHGRL